MTTETLTPSIAAPSDGADEMTTETNNETITFADLGAHPRAAATLARLGITNPTAIQAQAIPALLAGRDVIGQSRTGSGKTIAYGLPLIQRIDPQARRLQAVVLAPTRELASQVADVLMSIGAERGLRIAQLIGGRSYTPQREALRRGAQIAVGAPGRILDHLRQGWVDLSGVTFAVLDEADQMLDAGFAQDVERILNAMPADRQLALFTATLPKMTTDIAKRFLREPVSVSVGAPEGRPASTVTQIVYLTPREERLDALMTLLDRRRDATGNTLVFGRTKHGVQKLARQLIARGYPVLALHGNMSQNARDRAIAEFRSGQTSTLLATNVAARGLDVLSIEQVINYELPESAELFTHRVGRTGRMDNTGEAITLLTPDDLSAWRRMQRDLGLSGRPQPWPFGPRGDAANLAPAPAPTLEPVAAESAASASQEARDTTPTRGRQPRRDDRFGQRSERRSSGRAERPTRFGDFEGRPEGEGSEQRPGRRVERPTRFDRPGRTERPARSEGAEWDASRERRRPASQPPRRTSGWTSPNELDRPRPARGRPGERWSSNEERAGAGESRRPSRPQPRHESERVSRSDDQRGGFSQSRAGRPTSRPGARWDARSEGRGAARPTAHFNERPATGRATRAARPARPAHPARRGAGRFAGASDGRR